MSETSPEYHEAIRQAGRAVAAHVMKIDFTETSLAPEADNLRGRRDPVLEAAGDVAVLMHTNGAEGSGQAAGSPAAMRAHQVLTEGWPAVAAVADLLLTRERVSDEDVRVAVRSTVPQMEHTTAHAQHGSHGTPQPRRPGDHGQANPQTPNPREDAAGGVVDEGGGD